MLCRPIIIKAQVKQLKLVSGGFEILQLAKTVNKYGTRELYFWKKWFSFSFWILYSFSQFNDKFKRRLRPVSINKSWKSLHRWCALASLNEGIETRHRRDLCPGHICAETSVTPQWHSGLISGQPCISSMIKNSDFTFVLTSEMPIY